MVIQGVDQTGVTSFEPLEIYGTYVNISGPMSNVGIGEVPLSNVKLYLKGQTTGTDWLIYAVDSAGTFKFAVSDNADVHMPGHIYGKSAQFPGNVASTITSATPPAFPLDSQLWYNSDASAGGGGLYIRYNDGNTSQWVPASPASTGAVIQTVSFQTGAMATGTTLIPQDDSVPQITEGNEYMSLVITPKSATSRLLIEVTWMGSSTAVNNMAAALFQDGVADALAVGIHTYVNNYMCVIHYIHTVPSGSTAARTYRVRAGANNAGTTTFNGVNGTRLYGGVMASSIVIREVT
jgi:hypothetical protein